MKALLMLMMLCVGVARAQEDFSWVEFHFARPGLQVPEYTFQLYETVDGERGGSYRAISVGAPQANKYALTANGTQTEQKLDLEPAVKARLFALVQATHGLAHCDAHRKGIADTGAKRLRVHQAYKENSTDVQCDYNYSEDKAVVELTNLFQAMAVTLDMGRQMARDEKYDRLALDGDMTLLVEEVKDGRAAGLSNIRETLKGIAEDAAVLERVKVRAGKLLEFSLIEK